jgi:hypothetical protein
VLLPTQSGGPEKVAVDGNDRDRRAVDGPRPEEGAEGRESEIDAEEGQVSLGRLAFSVVGVVVMLALTVYFKIQGDGVSSFFAFLGALFVPVLAGTKVSSEPDHDDDDERHDDQQ